MPDYLLKIDKERPFFAELPYYVWGQVNYNSEGNCKTPLDRGWTWMELTNRETGESVEVTSDRDRWQVQGSDPAAARAAVFLSHRCDGELLRGQPENHVGNDFDDGIALYRASLVAEEFDNPVLRPFSTDDHAFWGAWKWIGFFATDFTWVARWIMDSVVRGDTRAVPLCIDWMRHGTFSEAQSAGLRHALNQLTGENFATDKEWIAWYRKWRVRRKYPKPNIGSWYSDRTGQPLPR
jgi:hypothetical protein